MPNSLPGCPGSGNLHCKYDVPPSPQRNARREHRDERRARWRGRHVLRSPAGPRDSGRDRCSVQARRARRRTTLLRAGRQPLPALAAQPAANWPHAAHLLHARPRRARAPACGTPRPRAGSLHRTSTCTSYTLNSSSLAAMPGHPQRWWVPRRQWQQPCRTHDTRTLPLLLLHQVSISCAAQQMQEGMRKELLNMIMPGLKVRAGVRMPARLGPPSRAALRPRAHARTPPPPPAVSPGLRNGAVHYVLPRGAR